MGSVPPQVKVALRVWRSRASRKLAMTKSSLLIGCGKGASRGGGARTGIHGGKGAPTSEGGPEEKAIGFSATLKGKE